MRRGLIAVVCVCLYSRSVLAAPVPPPSKAERARAIAELIKLRAEISTRHSRIGTGWQPDIAQQGGDREALAATRGEAPIVAIWLTNCKAPELAFPLLRFFPELERLRAPIQGPGARRITDREAKYLAGVPKLRYLNLSKTSVTDAAISCIARLHKLRSLTLFGTKITARGIHTLRSLTELESLELGAPGQGPSQVSDDSAEDVATLTGLKELHVTGPITDKGLIALSRLTHLRVLSVRTTSHVTAAGVSHLAALPQLEILNLLGMDVTDQGVAHLKTLRQLRELCLVNSQITDVGLKSLYGLPKLKLLFVAGSRVTPAGVRALHAARPDIRGLDESGRK